MVIVDTHAHIYSTDETAYPMRDDPLRPPSGTGSMEHLVREMDAAGVDRVMLIQTFTAYEYDNRFIADTSVAHPDRSRGVVTLDPTDPGAIDTLRDLHARANLGAIRMYPTRGENPTFAHEGHGRLIEAATELGLVTNILIDTPYADALAKHLSDYPSARIVLDHCMNLRAGASEILARTVDLASFPNLYAKLTFAITGSDEEYPCRDTHDLVHAVIEAYGAERCIWGSDFPCELWCPKVSYAQSLAIFSEEIPLPEDVRTRILGGTATDLYFGGDYSAPGLR
jgi:predicted TIM-barrel fold metal-dependent hydrolase